jgi:hypothetical protein
VHDAPANVSLPSELSSNRIIGSNPPETERPSKITSKAFCFSTQVAAQNVPRTPMPNMRGSVMLASMPPMPRFSFMSVGARSSKTFLT